MAAQEGQRDAMGTQSRLDTRRLRFERRDIAPFLLILACALLSQRAIYGGQFFGEDEVMQMHYAMRMLRALGELDFVQFGMAVVAPAHPPLRFFLSMPGILLFGPTEFGVRFGAILFSLLMACLVYVLGAEVGGRRVGLVSGLLVASSPVFNWTSMAFGWSVIVCALLLGIRVLRSHTLDLETQDGRRGCVQVNLLVIMAFLTNTGCVLFFVATGLVYLLHNYRRFWRLVWVFLPFALFYALYYFVNFVAAPYVAARYFGVTTPFGQLAQNLGRADQSYLNVTALVENLRGINGYFLPYVAWVVLACAIYYFVRHEWTVGLWLSVYAAGWSFVLTGGSEQYFLLAFVPTVPFGVKVLHDWVGWRGLYVGAGVVLVLMAAWNYLVFLRPYGSDDPRYPAALVRVGYVELGRVHNIYEPYAQIGAEIDRALAPDEGFVHDVSGSFTMYYYPSPHYVGHFGSPNLPYDYDDAADCYRLGMGDTAVRMVVTAKALCADGEGAPVAVTTFPDSKLKLYALDAAHVSAP